MVDPRFQNPWDLRQLGSTVLVFDEADLRRVITAAAAARTANLTIRTAKSFAATARFVLPSVCPGMNIIGSPGAPIIIDASMASLFSLNADRQAVRDMYVRVVDAAKPMTYLASVDAQMSGGATEGNNVSVEVVAAGGGIVNANAAFFYGQVRGNHSATLASKTIINGGLFGCSILGNTTAGAGNITLNGAGSRCSILGNELSGGAIDTSASTGGNLLAANSFVGGKTLHASDIDDDDKTANNAPADITVPTNHSLIVSGTLRLTGTQRLTAQGTARVRVT